MNIGHIYSPDFGNELNEIIEKWSQISSSTISKYGIKRCFGLSLFQKR